MEAPDGQRFGGGAALLGALLGAEAFKNTQIDNGLTSTQRDVIGGIDNRIRNTLNEKHFDAVRRELAGEVVATKPGTNTPYDHVREVREALSGQRGAINNLKTALGSPSLNPKGKREIENALSRASKSADKANQALNGRTTDRAHDKGDRGSNDASRANETKSTRGQR